MKRALIVGISDYSSTPFTSLGVAHADAVAVAEYLELDHYGFAVELIVNGDATKRRVTESVIAVISSQPDCFILYFAGHGVTTPFGSYLVTADSQEHDWGIDMSRILQAVASASPVFRMMTL